MCNCGTGTPSQPAATATQPVVTPCPACPDIEIIDQTGTVLSGTQTKIVGQRVQLWVRSTPTGSVLSSIQWTVQADTVKTYTQSTTTGTVTNLAAADLQVDNISIYWISGDFAGASKTVSVTATVAGAVKTKTLTFNVFRPKMDQFDTTVSSVNLCVGNYLSPGTWLAAFRPPSTVGIQWDAKVTAPPGGNGQIGFTQLVNASRERTLNNGTVQKLSSRGTSVLDGGLGIQYSGPKPISASAVATLNGGAYTDSPGTVLDVVFSGKGVNDRFRLYLMYRPAGADSIWTTLGMATWSWSGQTTRIGAPAATTNDWNTPTGTSLPNTNGADSTELPQWTGDVGSIRWA